MVKDFPDWQGGPGAEHPEKERRHHSRKKANKKAR